MVLGINPPAKEIQKISKETHLVTFCKKTRFSDSLALLLGKVCLCNAASSHLLLFTCLTTNLRRGSHILSIPLRGQLPPILLIRASARKGPSCAVVLSSDGFKAGSRFAKSRWSEMVRKVVYCDISRWIGHVLNLELFISLGRTLLERSEHTQKSQATALGIGSLPDRVLSVNIKMNSVP